MVAGGCSMLNIVVRSSRPNHALLGRLPGTPPPPEGIAISTTSVAHGGASLPRPAGGAAKQRRSSRGLQVELRTVAAPPLRLSKARCVGKATSDESAKQFSFKFTEANLRFEQLEKDANKLRARLESKEDLAPKSYDFGDNTVTAVAQPGITPSV